MKALPEVSSLEIKNKISLDEANQTRKRVFQQDIKTLRSRMREQGQVDLYFHPINLEFQNTLLDGFKWLRLLFKTYVVPRLQRWEIQWEWGLRTSVSNFNVYNFPSSFYEFSPVDDLWYFIPDIKQERTWRNRGQNWEKKQFVSWLKSWIESQIECIVFIYVVTCRFNFAELAFPKGSVVQASSWLLWCS